MEKIYFGVEAGRAKIELFARIKGEFVKKFETELGAMTTKVIDVTDDNFILQCCGSTPPCNVRLAISDIQRPEVDKILGSKVWVGTIFGNKILLDVEHPALVPLDSDIIYRYRISNTLYTSSIYGLELMMYSPGNQFNYSWYMFHGITESEVHFFENKKGTKLNDTHHDLYIVYEKFQEYYKQLTLPYDRIEFIHVNPENIRKPDGVGVKVLLTSSMVLPEKGYGRTKPFKIDMDLGGRVAFPCNNSYMLESVDGSMFCISTYEVDLITLQIQPIIKLNCTRSKYFFDPVSGRSEVAVISNPKTSMFAVTTLKLPVIDMVTHIEYHIDTSVTSVVQNYVNSRLTFTTRCTEGEKCDSKAIELGSVVYRVGSAEVQVDRKSISSIVENSGIGGRKFIIHNMPVEPKAIFIEILAKFPLKIVFLQQEETNRIDVVEGRTFWINYGVFPSPKLSEDVSLTFRANSFISVKKLTIRKIDSSQQLTITVNKAVSQIVELRKESTSSNSLEAGEESYILTMKRHSEATRIEEIVNIKNALRIEWPYPINFYASLEDAGRQTNYTYKVNDMPIDLLGGSDNSLNFNSSDISIDIIPYNIPTTVTDIKCKIFSAWEIPHESRQDDKIPRVNFKLYFKGKRVDISHQSKLSELTFSLDDLDNESNVRNTTLRISEGKTIHFACFDNREYNDIILNDGFTIMKAPILPNNSLVDVVKMYAMSKVLYFKTNLDLESYSQVTTRVVNTSNTSTSCILLSYTSGNWINNKTLGQSNIYKEREHYNIILKDNDLRETSFKLPYYDNSIETLFGRVTGMRIVFSTMIAEPNECTPFRIYSNFREYLPVQRSQVDPHSPYLINRGEYNEQENLYSKIVKDSGLPGNVTLMYVVATELDTMVYGKHFSIRDVNIFETKVVDLVKYGELDSWGTWAYVIAIFYFLCGMILLRKTFVKLFRIVANRINNDPVQADGDDVNEQEADDIPIDNQIELAVNAQMPEQQDGDEPEFDEDYEDPVEDNPPAPEQPYDIDDTVEQLNPIQRNNFDNDIN